LGFELVDYRSVTTSFQSTFGPNVPYYVKGYIYFGAIGAVVYSFIIGAVIGLVRKQLYLLQIYKSSLTKKLLVIHLNIIIYGLAQDSQFFISVIFDTFFLFALIYIPAYFLFGRTLHANLENG